jgi:hypothetical protein
MPVTHQIWLDTNQDGVDDYVVLNRDASGFGTITDGRQLAWVLNLATGAASAFFFAEHSTNTGNTVLYHLRRADRHERRQPAGDASEHGCDRPGLLLWRSRRYRQQG